MKKTIHYAVNVTSTEVEMFSIRCSINQAVDFLNIKKITVITDIIHIVRHILVCQLIHTNCSSLLFYLISEFFSTKVLTILLPFGTTLAMLNGLFIQLLIKKLNA